MIPDLTGGADDIVVPFQVDELDLRGRVIRLGRTAGTIIERHGYPAPVARLLAEATALTLLLGSGLKFDGRLILQTQTDGPVRMTSGVDSMLFGAHRHTVSPAGSVTLRSRDGSTLRAVVGITGRVRVCAVGQRSAGRPRC